MLRGLIIIFLFVFSFNSYATDLQVRNGKLSYPLTKEFNENGFRAWKVIGGGIEQEYQARFDKSLHVRDVSTGFRSASTVPVTLEARVSRKAVLSGAFGLVKAGAKLGIKAVPYVGAASYAYDAYQVVKSELEFEGYKWNEASEEFLKEWPARNCIWVRGKYDEVQKVSCYGVDSSVLSAYRKGGKSQREAEELMKGQMEKLAGPFWEKRKKELDKDSGSKFWEYFHLDECRFDLNGGNCSVKRGSDGRSPISFTLSMRDTEILDNEKFLQLFTSFIDANPRPFVEGTGKPEYQENIKVPAGTVVTIGPVTPENGKPVQITITFGQDSNGNTTAEVATTQRPDLTPGGSEAPNTKPDPDPSPNPDGKPDKKPDDKPDPDGNPDKRPDDKPDSDDDPSDKDKRKEDKKDDKKEESKGLLCNVFPDILACSEKGDVEEQEEPFKIPHTNNDTTFSPDFFLPDNGVCPAPRTATYLGITMEFKYDMICNFAEMIRFLVIGIAAVVAAYIMFSSRKD
ncbi:TspB protein [Neisseria subflava]|uniref:IgG-binding virulence factor TspB family protein n=1 Tax=Neisseria subflava TaxID=28449 RepID=UPI00202A18EB|nr:IgG-binding virulence factor TspB family protein [Neisseria subflava]MCL9790915.1 TspB protein [Neisseria subflava]DAP88802.1 MAG TPA: attachment protein [Inoviridae sp.]